MWETEPWAVAERDPRLDGWFVVARPAAGVYCRPSCPVVAGEDGEVHLPTSAAAQQAGYRACDRCHPDAAPGSPAWDLRDDLAGRAMRLVADGLVDRAGVAGLAAALGSTGPALERLLVAEAGTGPLALAGARRASTARVLLEATSLPLAEVAAAAGFAGARQLDAAVRAVFGRPAGGLRRTRPAAGAAGVAGAAGGSVVLHLPFRHPFRPDNLFGHLALTAAPGVEEVRRGTYRRTLRLPHGYGIVGLRPAPNHIVCELLVEDWRDVPVAVARCRFLLDLDADPHLVDGALGIDPVLREELARAPGRRIPRTVDGAEMAIRAVLGQQVSTAAARTTTARLVASQGEPVDDPAGGLTRRFPNPEELNPPATGLPAARCRTLARLVEALREGELDLGPGADRAAAHRTLAALPGVGPWTLGVVAMRALADADAFPATDLGVRHAAARLALPGSPAALTAYAERWRPFRAYAVQYLWGALPHAINRWPPPEPRGDP